MLPPTTALIQAERDALVCLGLFADCYTRFDIPIKYPSESAPSHILGLNIHAAVIDNVDGDLLALDRNTIHSDASPLQHGEQRALRVAIARVAEKRPRQPGQAIEDYYRASMFMGKGSKPKDFIDLGATLYTTLEPCPMCASSSLVCRVKRLVYMLPDTRFGGAWTILKQNYYKDDEARYERLNVNNGGSKFADKVGLLHDRMVNKADKLRKKGVRDTHFLDFCRNELAEAFKLLVATKVSDLASVTVDETRNAFTLRRLQNALNIPTTND